MKRRQAGVSLLEMVVALLAAALLALPLASTVRVVNGAAGWVGSLAAATQLRSLDLRLHWDVAGNSWTPAAMAAWAGCPSFPCRQPLPLHGYCAGGPGGLMAVTWKLSPDTGEVSRADLAAGTSAIVARGVAGMTWSGRPDGALEVEVVIDGVQRVLVLLPLVR